MYSSIEENDRKTVIERCYWPLLNLAEKGCKLGIELTGLTLEFIKSVDPVWIEKLKKMLDEYKVELIGSGYSQIIGPLVPAEVNDWNQRLGLDVYREILGITPKIALIVFSVGIWYSDANISLIMSFLVIP